MRRLLAFPFLLLLALSTGAATNRIPVNLDFESGAPGAVPSGWISPTTGAGYTAALSTESPKQGKQSVRLSGKPAGEPGRPAFGNVMQQIDATPFRGKRVRFRGAVRVQGAAASAGLWMRVDRPERQMGFFENMQARPIRAGEWAYYEISGDVASDAVLLNIGMLLEREGSAWLDDITIETVAKREARSAPPRAIAPRGLENLIAFTRLFGVVRHFHPSDEAATADWDAIAVDGAAAVEGARNASELATRLAEVFLPVAPSVRIHPSNAPPKTPLVKPSAAQTIVAWEHNGLGQGTMPPGQIYTSERVRRAAGRPDTRFADPLQPMQLDLGGGVAASVPLAVYADATRTLPAASRKALAHPDAEYTGNDRATRIGGVVILWNALQHFYPYFDVIGVDWRSELRRALNAAGTDRGEAAFLGTLERMIAAIDDGHGSISHPSIVGRATLPLLWRVAGDALVIMNVDPSVKDLQPGDEVIAIDGKPAPQLLRETRTLISGTPQWKRWTALNRIAGGDAGSKVALTIRDADGSTRNVTLTRTATPNVGEPRPKEVAELKPGLWYVDLTRIDDAGFEASLGKLATARAIVFDLRGYPRVGTKPLRHMIDSATQSARWNIPIVRRPDRKDVAWRTDGRWTLEPLKPRLTKNIAFVTDGRAISYGESWMGIVEAYKLGHIVGETTAGTNGNVNLLPLPGGYRIAFTGMKVLKHDGSRHHGVGIAPTVPVSPAVPAIRAGRDEQLEKAMELVEQKMSGDQPATENGESITKNSPRIITEGAIPNIW